VESFKCAQISLLHDILCILVMLNNPTRKIVSGIQESQEGLFKAPPFFSHYRYGPQLASIYSSLEPVSYKGNKLKLILMESAIQILAGRQLIQAFEFDNGHIFLVLDGGLHFGIRSSRL